MTRKLDRDARLILAGLLAFALFFRLATLMMIHTGIDERDYWNSATAIARGLPYPELSHRTNRFAVILPVAAAQALLGSHPNVYYVLPVINVMVQAGVAFLIGYRLRGKLAGFLASLGLVMFPYMIRAGSQVRPEVFSITYILLALLAFLDYLERKEAWLPPLLWTAGWLFLAYETKITNLFFLPGFLIAILVYRRSLREAFILGGVLLGLYVLETGAYALLTDYKLGMLEVITAKHFSADKPFILESFWGLFGRYAPDKLQPYWSIPFLVFLIVGVRELVRGGDRRLGAIIMTALSFFTCITFEVKTFFPVTPAEPFINRYFSSVLGPVALVLGVYLAKLAAGAASRFPAPRRRLSWEPYAALLAAGGLALLALAALPGLPRAARQYLNNPLAPASHPLALNETYRREVNRAWDEGRVILAAGSLAGYNAISAAASYYLDVERYGEGGRPGPERLTVDGMTFNALRRPGVAVEAPRYLAAVRQPFRLAELPASGLPGLGGEAFSGGAGGRDAVEADE